LLGRWCLRRPPATGITVIIRTVTTGVRKVRSGQDPAKFAGSFDCLHDLPERQDFQCCC
jgi:hypothetical protein